MRRSGRLNIAVKAVRKAAAAVQRLGRFADDIKVSEKSPGDFVTNADMLSERIVIEELAAAFPADGILSEESGASGDQGSCWVLDPIDGTTNFVNGLPACSISLAWCEGGQPQLGVIHDIGSDDVYLAERGRGAYRNDQRLRVSGRRKFAHALIGSTGRPGTRDWRWQFLGKVARETIGFRRIGSGALDFAYTAAGHLDAVFGSNLRYWDYAAGAVILAEAKGSFFADLDGGREVPFGAKLGTIVYGTPRIAAHLHREAASFKEAAAS